ncbi:hypothetical protein [Nannocystis pusilla]|uniref:hypothetical protein n=1 Tax=Nannocystis pusilla TaxID=889268 RepID=UPI003BF3132B
MRLRLTLLVMSLVGIGLVIFFAGGAPSTADGSTTEGAGPRAESESLPAYGTVTEAGEVSPLLNRRLDNFTEGLVELLSQVPQPPSHEQALMKLELMQEDDRIKILSIRDPRQ